MRRLLDDGSAEPYRRLVDSITDYAIFLLTPTGHIASWNPGAQRIKGYRADEIIGRHFSQFYTDEALATGWPEEELRRASADGRLEDEGWRLRSDGSRFWAHVVITALHDTSGGLLGFSKVTQDLTDRREQQLRIADSERTLRLLVESVVDYAIYSMDAQGVITTWNVGAERIKGFTPSEAIGRSFAMFYLPEEIACGAPQAALQLAAERGHFESEGWRLRKDGSRLWAATTISAIRDESGRLVGYSKVTRDLTERKRVETLEIEGRRVNEFIAMLSHELRNPLAPIRNAAAILASFGDRPEIAWSAEVIGRQVGHLSRLVDDLLDVSRIVRGKIRLVPQALDLNTIVRTAVEAHQSDVEAQGHTLALRLASAPMPVRGDATRLTQVLANLLTNSARYTPRGGRIDVSVHQDAGKAVLRVADNGIGMTDELLQRAFDPFTRGDPAPDRADSGLGVGLTLVRSIVDLHGGEVEAASPGPGQGTTMTVRLPIDRAEPTGPRAEPPDPLPAALEGSRGLGAERRVLVVDDNQDAAESLALLLRMQGHEVGIAHDGHEALAQATAMRPSTVLLDIGLPGIDGYEVARRLRALPGLEGVHLIALTGYGQDSDREASRAAGFALHVTKPVTLDQLQRIIE